MSCARITLIALFLIEVFINNQRVEARENLTTFSIDTILFDKNILDSIIIGDSKACTAFKNALTGNFNNLKDEESGWILQMIDSWPKIPSGLLTRHLVDYGNYDECLAIDESFAGENVRGQYCAYGINIAFSKDFVINLSTCIPDSCQLADTIIANIATSSSLCHTFDDTVELTWDDWAVIGVFIFIGCLILLSTTIDTILYYTKPDNVAKYNALIAFSVLTNGRKLFAVSDSSSQVACLNGIRTISLMWIIAGHRFVSLTAIPQVNALDGLDFKNGIASSYISSGRAAVDTFFFLSGFLLSFNYFKGVLSAISKAEAKHSSRVQNPLTPSKIPMLYIHRLLRITPALTAVFFTQITIMRRIGSGPIWPIMTDMMVKPCTDWWWSFYLYVQNYVNYHEMCIIPTWYLSADMQMFLISPLLLIPLGELIIKKRKKLAYLGLGLIIVLCIIIPMIIDFFRTFIIDNIYETHPRLSVYTMGIFFGILVNDCKNIKIQINWFVNLVLWALSIGVMLTIVLTMHDTEVYPEQVKNNLFFTFSRPAWTLALSWIIFACHFGYGGPVNWFLSKSIFQIVTRLSFSMYLLHNLVITASIGSAKTAIHFSQYESIYLWCGDFIFTFLLSIIWVLCFESPFVVIEKIIFPSGNKKQSAKTPVEPTAPTLPEHDRQD